MMSAATKSGGPKLGVERKRVYILVGLLVVLAIVFFVNRSSDAPEASATSTVSSTAPIPSPVPTRQPNIRREPTRSARPTQPGQSQVQEYRPSIKGIKEGLTDPTQVDPTLKLDELARLQNVQFEPGSRSLFEFSQPPVPKPDPVKPVHPTTAATSGAATPTTPAVPVTPVKPPPPPIPLKYYGFAGSAPNKRALFLDGDEILVAAEGGTMKNRYKVIRIGVNSVVVEDTANKNQQTLPLVEEAQ